MKPRYLVFFLMGMDSISLRFFKLVGPARTTDLSLCNLNPNFSRLSIPLMTFFAFSRSLARASMSSQKASSFFASITCCRSETCVRQW